MALNPRQELFCNEYIIDFNATQAAIRAGYNPKNARIIAAENLSKLNISKRIEELKKDIFSIVGITQAKVYREYKRIALADIRKFYDDNGVLKNIKDLDDDSAAVLIGVEADEIYVMGEHIGTTKKIKLADKKGALDSLVKIAGWAAPDKLDVNDNREPTTIKSPDGTIITL